MNYYETLYIIHPALDSGRVKEMIIRGGENIYPKEIENILLEHEAISEVAIVGIPDKKYGEIVGCFIKFEIIASGCML